MAILVYLSLNMVFSVKKSITLFGQHCKIKKTISFSGELFGTFPLFDLLMLAVIRTEIEMVRKMEMAKEMEMEMTKRC